MDKIIEFKSIHRFMNTLSYRLEWRILFYNRKYKDLNIRNNNKR